MVRMGKEYSREGFISRKVLNLLLWESHRNLTSKLHLHQQPDLKI